MSRLNKLRHWLSQNPLASLLRQVEASNRFFTLSLDLLCIAGFGVRRKTAPPSRDRKRAVFAAQEILRTLLRF